MRQIFNTLFFLFVLAADKKKLQLADKYLELKKRGKLKKFLSKKRKRNAGKDRKKLPNQPQRRPVMKTSSSSSWNVAGVILQSNQLSCSLFLTNRLFCCQRLQGCLYMNTNRWNIKNVLVFGFKVQKVSQVLWWSCFTSNMVLFLFELILSDRH